MKMRHMDSVDSQFYKIAAGLWSIQMCLVLILLVIFQESTGYPHKVDYPLPHIALLLLGTGILSVGSYGYWRHRAAIDCLAERRSEGPIGLLSVAVFFIQAYLFYNIYFLTDWDVKNITATAKNLVSDNWEIRYNFDRYPNNLVLTRILTILFRLNNAFGSVAEPEFFVILVQCAASCVAGFVLYQVVKGLTKPACGYAVWLVYVLHVAFNPWLTIPYTDAMTLLIPISVLRLYQTARTGKYALLKWAAMGFLCAFGYQLKPQCVIILIAIVLCEGVGFLGRNPQWADRLKRLGMAAIGAAAALILCSRVLIPSLGIETDPEQRFGPSHYLMMGLNWDTCGSWSGDDVSYSGSFATAAERTNANLQAAKGRLQDMGFTGLIKHLARKSLLNFGDGTYAWGVEGIFYAYIFPERNDFASPLLREIFYTTGKYYPCFAVFQQLIWTTILLSSAGILMYLLTEKEKAQEVGVITLSLVGLVWFQTIFEARARYFFAYAPLFLVAATLGWIGFVRFFRNRIRKKRHRPCH